MSGLGNHFVYFTGSSKNQMKFNLFGMHSFICILQPTLTRQFKIPLLHKSSRTITNAIDIFLL